MSESDSMFGPLVGASDPIGDGVRAAAADLARVKQAFEQWLMRKLELERARQEREQGSDLDDVKDLLERIADGFDSKRREVDAELDGDPGQGRPQDVGEDVDAGLDSDPREGTASIAEEAVTETVRSVDDYVADLEEARAVQASKEAFEASMHADEDFGADRTPVAEATGEARETENVAVDEAEDVDEAKETGDDEQVQVEESEAQAAEGAAERDADTATDLRTEQDGHGQADAGRAAASEATAETAKASAQAHRAGAAHGAAASHEHHQAPGNAWPNGSKPAQLAGSAFPNGQAYDAKAQSPKRAPAPAKSPAREKGRGL